MSVKNYVSAKIHGIRVTDKHLRHTGSQTLPMSLLEAAGIEPYEQVHVVNMNNGERWITYALPGNEGECILNGAAARKGEVGDELIIIVYQQAEKFPGARAVFCNPDNTMLEVKPYACS